MAGTKHPAEAMGFVLFLTSCFLPSKKVFFSPKEKKKPAATFFSPLEKKKGKRSVHNKRNESVGERSALGEASTEVLVDSAEVRMSA